MNINNFDDNHIAAAIANLNAAQQICADTEVDYLIQLALLELTIGHSNDAVFVVEAKDALSNLKGGQ